ncbi:Transcriptional repressor p66-beta [Sarcoptes scabiei]|uniref:Transcriptional repressor p66-beta n=1 Tax=Sarcoptes scabiei TaxID=52283 RepID=A0A834RJH9_SARSC|nr:Transcriptional repressor p66-beta [Sarcoptes scabiei]UXI15396.1 proprotein convertase subtilisin/kexin type 4 [Sarcoptes scabiei]
MSHSQTENDSFEDISPLVNEKAMEIDDQEDCNVDPDEESKLSDISSEKSLSDEIEKDPDVIKASQQASNLNDVSSETFSEKINHDESIDIDAIETEKQNKDDSPTNAKSEQEIQKSAIKNDVLDGISIDEEKNSMNSTHEIDDKSVHVTETDKTQDLNNMDNHSTASNELSKADIKIDEESIIISKVESDDSPISSDEDSRKRTRLNSFQDSAVEDLSLPTKKRSYLNGNNSSSNDENDDKLFARNELQKQTSCPKTLDATDHDVNIENSKNQNNLCNDDVEDEYNLKQKLIRHLKQQLLNEEMKLLLLKKIKQSQLKENLSQQQNNVSASNTNNLVHNHQQSNNHNHHQNSSQSHHNRQQNVAQNYSSAAAAAAANLVGMNLTPNLRDLNLLTNNHFQAGLNSALNFSINSPNAVNLHLNQNNMINNNVAHNNSNLMQKNNSNAVNFSINQSPMQAHMSKTSKNSPMMNPPFASSNIGRSPYNYLNNPLSAPPPANHSSSSSNNSKQRMSNSESLASGKSNQHNRAIASSPSLGHNFNESRHSSSKHNQIPQSSSPLTNQIDAKANEQILLQKQLTTLKQTMRKHLEKMPHPKIIPSEMHFIPNPSNAEFIYYVGLENVVNYLTGSNQTPQPPEPFECVQCGTDFTPVWKWKDRTNPNKPTVICEKCVAKNLKKIISEDYQKEVNSFSKTFSEIEKHLAATSANVNPTPTSAPTVSSHPTSSSSSNQSSQSNTQQSQSRQSTHHPSINVLGSSNNNSSLNFNLPQAHSNSPLSAMSASQMAAMALLMPQAGQANNHQVSTPPAAHSGSVRSSSQNSNIPISPGASSLFGTNQAQAAAAALTFLQHLQSIPKFNQAQSLLLAQQLLANANTNAATVNQNAAMAQLLNFPNIFYSSLLAASLANQKTPNNSQSPLNASGIPRQLLMEMLPNLAGASGGSGSSAVHHSRVNSNNHSQSMPQQNWKS